MEVSQVESMLFVVNSKDFTELKEQVSALSKQLALKRSDDQSGELFTPKETMNILKIKSPKTLWKYRDCGDLPSISFGGKILFSRSTIDCFIKKYSN